MSHTKPLQWRPFQREGWRHQDSSRPRLEYILRPHRIEVNKKNGCLCNVRKRIG